MLLAATLAIAGLSGALLARRSAPAAAFAAIGRAVPASPTSGTPQELDRRPAPIAASALVADATAADGGQRDSDASPASLEAWRCRFAGAEDLAAQLAVLAAAARSDRAAHAELSIAALTFEQGREPRLREAALSGLQSAARESEPALRALRDDVVRCTEATLEERRRAAESYAECAAPAEVAEELRWVALEPAPARDVLAAALDRGTSRRLAAESALVCGTTEERRSEPVVAAGEGAIR